MNKSIEDVETESRPVREAPTAGEQHGTRHRRVLQLGGAASVFAAAVTFPGRVWAQIADPAPSNAGLPGGALVTQVLGWGKWLGLAACVLAIVYGAATWRGMGGNSGRGVEGKAYVGAGMIGAMLIGLAVIAVNTLYGAGAAGG